MLAGTPLAGLDSAALNLALPGSYATTMFRIIAVSIPATVTAIIT
jgi:hypothetical protein